MHPLHPCIQPPGTRTVAPARSHVLPLLVTAHHVRTLRRVWRGHGQPAAAAAAAGGTCVRAHQVDSTYPRRCCAWRHRSAKTVMAAPMAHPATKNAAPAMAKPRLGEPLLPWRAAVAPLDAASEEETPLSAADGQADADDADVREAEAPVAWGSAKEPSTPSKIGKVAGSIRSTAARISPRCSISGSAATMYEPAAPLVPLPV
ncbi:hypothetical protein PLESTM_000045100 [Pleodorina starrii]|nr:hypothetical protein PLESTM_000045100 [Pleodorina starrii]